MAQQQYERVKYYQTTAAERAQFMADNAEALFRKGEIEYVEYIQALDAVLQIRLNQQQALYQYQLAAFSLLQLRNQQIH